MAGYPSRPPYPFPAISYRLSAVGSTCDGQRNSVRHGLEAEPRSHAARRVCPWGRWAPVLSYLVFQNAGSAALVSGAT
jgi:hypothetical protein